MKYNIPLMNALVLYVGTQAIQYIHSKGQTPGMATIAHSSHMDIFQNLAVDMDTEGVKLVQFDAFLLCRVIVILNTCASSKKLCRLCYSA